LAQSGAAAALSAFPLRDAVFTLPLPPFGVTTSFNALTSIPSRGGSDRGSGPVERLSDAPLITGQQAPSIVGAFAVLGGPGLRRWRRRRRRRRCSLRPRRS